MSKSSSKNIKYEKTSDSDADSTVNENQIQTSADRGLAKHRPYTSFIGRANGKKENAYGKSGKKSKPGSKGKTTYFKGDLMII